MLQSGWEGLPGNGGQLSNNFTFVVGDDAKSLMIYAGSNEVQITHVARGCWPDGSVETETTQAKFE